MPFDQRSLIHQEAWFPPCVVRQNQQQQQQQKISRQFFTIFKQKCSNLRPLLSITFSQGFQISKNIGHPTSGSGANRRLKVPQKLTHTWTDKQTDGHTDTRTFRLIESIRPEG